LREKNVQFNLNRFDIEFGEIRKTNTSRVFANEILVKGVSAISRTMATASGLEKSS
jgi:hypothetical protein